MSAAQFAAALTDYGPDTAPFRGTLAEATAYCQQLAARHYENFSVVTWLLPRALRPHFAAVYAYCRWADDLADETGDPELSRELLNWWEAQLAACYRGLPARHPVFLALGETIRRFSIPREPFADLLRAFQQDQNRNRYATVNQLCDYCHGSADPVGRIVLYLFRCFTHERAALADSICTGLQWANFCQDVARDLRIRNRIYLPQESWAACGVTEGDFMAPRAGSPMRCLIEREVSRAEEYIHKGWPLVKLLPPVLGRNIAAIARGGLAICEAIRRQDFDVLQLRPTVGKWQKLCLLLQSRFLPLPDSLFEAAAIQASAGTSLPTSAEVCQ